MPHFPRIVKWNREQTEYLYKRLGKTMCLEGPAGTRSYPNHDEAVKAGKYYIPKALLVNATTGEPAEGREGEPVALRRNPRFPGPDDQFVPTEPHPDLTVTIIPDTGLVVLDHLPPRNQ
jgi:hypothetical protein